MGDNNGKAIIDASAHFIAGWVSGCAGVLVSHPFDTVKVRLQTQGVIEGAAHSWYSSMEFSSVWCLW